MASENVFFNASAFIAGLFLLEFGADRFIDHTAIIAKRLGVSPTLIALLTAGAEWEELAVIIAAVSQGRSTLALGNILGSSISNILGAFSLGLLFQSGEVVFDRSSKIYTALTLLFTTILVFYLAFFKSLGRVFGGVLVVLFVGYVASIGYYIYKGIMAAPEDDSDDDSDDESDDGHDSDTESVSDGSNDTLKNDKAPRGEAIPLRDVMPLDDGERTATSNMHTTKKPGRSMTYHVVQLVAGFLALSLSGYILSHSVAAIADAFALSSTVLGITILSIATTLPEKFVAICSGSRGQNGIVVANTAGSNIFLMTLCSGVLLLTGNLEALMKSVTIFDLLATWLSSAIFFAIVFVGAKRWMGGALLVLYLGFIGAEFAFYRT